MTRWFRDDFSDAVWESEALTAAEKAVAETYARHARDERGEKTAGADLSWLTYPRLMSKAGIKRRATVSAAVERLEELGWLDPVERVSRRATVYRLTIPRSSDVGTTDAGSARNYGSSDVGTTVVPLADHGSSTFASGSSDVGTQPLGPLKKQPLTTSSSCGDERFEPSPATPKEGEEGEDQKKTAGKIADRYADRITFIEAKRLTAPIAAALRAGWTEDGIVAELDQPTTGLASVAAGLISRAKNLGDPPSAEPAKQERPPWCGTCESDRIRQRTIEDPFGGGVRVILCPECNPRSPNWTPKPNPFGQGGKWESSDKYDPNTGSWTPRQPQPNGHRPRSNPNRHEPFRNPDPADYHQPL